MLSVLRGYNWLTVTKSYLFLRNRKLSYIWTYSIVTKSYLFFLDTKPIPPIVTKKYLTVTTKYWL